MSGTKTGKRFLGSCCALVFLGSLAIVAVFVMFMTNSEGFFDALDELTGARPIARPLATLDLTQQAIEVAILPDTQVDYAAQGCPSDKDIPAHAVEAWGHTVQAAFAGQTDQDQTEERLVGIIDDAGGIAQCLASIRVKGTPRGYSTYDQFARDAYGMPADVSITDIYELHRLAKNPQTYLDQGVELRAVYDDTMQSKPRQAALWLIRRMPVYHPEEGWITFDRYARKMNEDLGSVNPNSRFEQDPLGTAFDMMTGNYTQEDVADWFAFE